METRQNTNDFAKGMTNIPSDNICPDDSVAAEWNMIFRNGEHCPIQAPVDMGIFVNESFYILYIHEVHKGKHYVGVNGSGNLVYISDNDTELKTIDITYSDYTKQTQVTSIGNTLIVNVKDESIRYFLWKTSEEATGFSYKYIGDRLPSASLNFRFTDSKLNEFAISYGKIEGMFSVKDNIVSWTSDKEKDVEAFFAGLYAECKKKVSEVKGFCNPFMVRYALRLFDGTYTNISTPILMFPSVTVNTCGRLKIDDANTFQMNTIIKRLEYISTKDLRDWNDIIKNIGIFVTNPVDVVDTGLPTRDAYNSIAYDTVIWKNIYSGKDVVNSGMFYEKEEISDDNPKQYIKKFLKTKSQSDIIHELIASSVFYKIGDINLSPSNGYEKTKYIIKAHDLENLVTLEQLDHDDYYSQCPKTGNDIYVYNKRLHLSNISRGFFEGNDVFTPFFSLRDNTSVTEPSKPREFSAFVYIKTNSGIKIIKKHYVTNDVFGIYYFYPDPRAYKVEFYQDDDETKKFWKALDLKPHPLLNGAYYISEKLPDSDTMKEPADSIVKNMPTENSTPEKLDNEVWVSEVNNPFVFNASGVNTVGNGSIIGIISNTQALSQGQFGQFPLFCFTTDGVWTLQTSSEGTYSSAHPISREICNNKDSITATDNLVFFSSEKGLMMINGSEVSCVSSQLSGKTYIPTPKEGELYATANIEPVSFVDFIKKCKIAYDYRDNLLWIVNQNYRHCFLLSIESGAYAMTTLDGYPVNIINDYPDTLIEVDYGQSEYMTFSLINRPNINDDERRISSFIISRPMKIGDQNSLKTPTMIRYIGNNNQKAVLKMRLFASDDLVNWVRINSLRGMGFKYYKYNFIFEDLLPTDTFSGVTERWQFKYQSKFR